MTEGTQDGEESSVWDRLRRRKVVQWTLAYAAGAWGFLQGLAYVSTLLDWPARLQKLTGLALLIGLPIALTLAWYHGDRGHRRVTRVELAILTLLLVLGGSLFWRYQHASETSTPVATASRSAPATASLIVAAAPSEKSIAVLPFVDMSPDQSQEYMADGMAEELLNLLAKAPELKVIARTSSFAFKDEKRPVAEIAKILNVSNILEGSVRTSGNTIRITAQLIQTADSTQLWSETYDRPLGEIFAIQDEIAGAIAQALQIQFMGGSVDRREGGTQNLEAHQLYLRAWNGETWNSESSLNAAEAYLKQAIKLDPDFGLAWSALASVDRLRVEAGYLGATEGTERARRLAQHALELSPGSAHAHATLASIHLNYDWDWAAAQSEIRQALELQPTDSRVLLHAARLSATLGRWDDAERQLQAALSRDPLNSYAIFNLGLVYYRSGKLEQSEATLRKLLELSPDFPWTRGLLGAVLVEQGKSEAALSVVQQGADEPTRILALPVVLAAAGRSAEADEAIQALIGRWAESGAFYVAQAYAYRGDHDRALEWLERAYQQKDPALIEIIGEPLFKGLADDPRFKAFLSKMKLSDG